MGALIGIAIFLALIVYSSFSWGFVCYKFWYWFLMPVFPEIPEITFLQAVGIMLFISLFKNKNQAQIKNAYKDKDGQWSSVILTPWITLFAGYVIYLIISSS